MELSKRRLPMEQLAQLITLQLESGGRANLTVTGSSMLPMLRNGVDAVELIQPTGQGQKGDILLYRRKNGQYVLHRVIALTDSGYICCGDNQAEREPVDREQVLAVVDGFTRGGKRYDLSNGFYRLYTALWVGLFPLRRYYIAVRRPLGRLRTRLKKKWKK